MCPDMAYSIILLEHTTFEILAEHNKYHDY
jgi:hypothetical protein